MAMWRRCALPVLAMLPRRVRFDLFKGGCSPVICSVDRAKMNIFWSRRGVQKLDCGCWPQVCWRTP